MVAADNLGAVKLLTIQTQNNGTTFGVIGGRSIMSVTAKTPAFAFDPNSDNAVDNFKVVFLQT